MKTLTEEAFDKLVKRSDDKLVIVDCYADWCAPCKILKPTLEKVSSQMQDSVEIFEADIEENPGLIKRFGIKSIPTLLWFRNGTLVKTTVGAIRENQLVEEISKLESMK
jgi:thioredoxin 1